MTDKRKICKNQAIVFRPETIGKSAITNKDRVNDIIHRAVSWAQERGITNDDIASILVEEYNSLEVDFWDHFDYDEISESMKY